MSSHVKISQHISATNKIVSYTDKLNNRNKGHKQTQNNRYSWNHRFYTAKTLQHSASEFTMPQTTTEGVVLANKIQSSQIYKMWMKENTNEMKDWWKSIQLQNTIKCNTEYKQLNRVSQLQNLIIIMWYMIERYIIYDDVWLDDE